MRKKILLLLLCACVTYSAAAAGSNSAFDVGEYLGTRGLMLAILVIFAAGVGVSLTPCVYPMIPITLAIIGARSAEQKPLTGFLRSLVFVIGIAVVYSALGFFVARSDSRTMGFLFQKWWFVLLISVFFAAMGLSMLGLFNIQMPARLSGKLQAGAGRGGGGFVGAFLLGLVTGIVASPCGSPVLVSVLFFAAQSGKGAIGFLLLFSYALGIGMLFLLLGTFPSLLKSLPKSGEWMEDVKKLMGVVLIGVAVYYLKFVLPALVFWLLVLGLSLAAGLLIAVKASARRTSRGPRLLWRTTGVALALYAIFVAFYHVPPAFASKRDTSPSPRQIAMMAKEAVHKMAAEEPAKTAQPDTVTATPKTDTVPTAASPVSTPIPTAPVATSPATEQVSSDDEWLTDEATALAEAKEAGKPAMIDFGADWCAACKELEHKTFPDPKVAEVLKGFVKVRIDCTEESDETKLLWKKYSVKSLPAVQFIDKDGNWLSKLSLFTYEPPEEFLERLKQVPK